MAVSDTYAYVLPCGRDAEVLWTHVIADSYDEHEGTCPHCQPAAAALRSLHQATKHLASLDTAPSPDLTARIMRAVRAERSHTQRLVLDASSHGITQITAPAAAVVLRFAANHTPDATVRSCTVEPDPRDGPGRHLIQITLTLRYRAYGATTVAAVRHLVHVAARELVGFEISRIDITIIDVTTPDL